MRVCVGPDLDSTTAQACLKELKEQCLYLHFDGTRYGFKRDPNVTLLVEQEADSVGRDENRVRGEIRTMIEARVAGHRSAIIWPETPAALDDKDPSFVIGYLPFEFGSKAGGTREAEALEYFEKAGSMPRSYRNGVGLAVPAGEQMEILRRAVRYLLAIQSVRDKSRQLGLTKAQEDQLRERGSTERNAAESALLKLYVEVWLPRVENGGMGIDRVAVGGRPLQQTLDANRRARIHDRVVELLSTLQPKVFGTVKPGKLVELFRLGEGDPAKLGMRTSEVVSGFYSFLGFPRLWSDLAIRGAVKEGVEKRIFGYTTGSPALGPDQKYQIERSKVVFDRSIAEDEIDLQSGFLIAPSAIAAEPVPIATPGPAPSPGPIPPVAPGPPVPGGATLVTGPDTGPQRSVSFEFSADRNQIYTAWNAIANLANQADTVKISVVATNEKGFDQSKLQNGVLEPLREIKLID